jgi:SAM-dependent methyltransferase
MFSESAAVYDLIYQSFKDYDAEAAQIAEYIKSNAPNAQSILDVGCGTGEHARLLAQHYGYHVDGVDIEPEFVRLAREKNPDGQFWQVDMRAFDTGKEYDVVLCLFSSIGYVKTLDGVRATLANFSSHLRDDGLILLEPWFPPEAWNPGRVDMMTAETEGLKVCRMSHSDVQGTLSIVTFEYLLGRPGGIERLQEIHELGLFTVEQMKASFTDAGLSVSYDEGGPSGRGMYVARKAV